MIFSTLASVGGRLALVVIFFMSAVGNKIPQFSEVAGYMRSEGVPLPQFSLAGAIVFLVLGSVLVAVGYRARIGATLLLIFLALATYYFHDFWTLEGEQAQQQMIQFMKNLSMAGAMLFIIGNGPGLGSIDARRRKLSSDGTNHS